MNMINCSTKCEHSSKTHLDCMEPTPIFCNISLFFEIRRFMERAISKE